MPKKGRFFFENTKTAHFGPKADIQKFGFLSTHYSSHPYLQGTARAGLMHERPRARGHDREIRLPLQDLRRF